MHWVERRELLAFVETLVPTPSEPVFVIVQPVNVNRGEVVSNFGVPFTQSLCKFARVEFLESGACRLCRFVATGIKG